MQTEEENEGQLYVQVTSKINNRPIPNASVTISFTGEPDSTVAELTTDESGQTEPIELETPPKSYSLFPTQEQQPYAEYTVRVNASGYESVDVSGSELFQNTTSIQPIPMDVRTGSIPAEATPCTRKNVTVNNSSLFWYICAAQTEYRYACRIGA